MKKILFITLAGFIITSCSGKQPQEKVEEKVDSTVVDSVEVQTPQQEKAKTEVRDMTFEEAAGVYESLDDDMNAVARIVLMADGTATTIHGNTICMKIKDIEAEEECYDYDEDTRTLKNEQGAVYYRQIEE